MAKQLHRTLLSIATTAGVAAAPLALSVPAASAQPITETFELHFCGEDPPGYPICVDQVLTATTNTTPSGAYQVQGDASTHFTQEYPPWVGCTTDIHLDETFKVRVNPDGHGVTRLLREDHTVQVCDESGTTYDCSATTFVHFVGDRAVIERLELECAVPPEAAQQHA